MQIYKVIGALYGDEGKGYKVNELAKLNKTAIVVKHNGTAQAGHTVRASDKEHIFKTFGSGTFQGLKTILYKTFFVCPMSLIIEAKQLDLLVSKPLSNLIIDARCEVVLPWDKIQNLERKENHGTCGFGLLEAVLRKKELSITIDTLLTELNKGNLENFVANLRNSYYNGKCELYGSELVFNWCNDVKEVLTKATISYDLLEEIENHDLIFEHGQGLGLSESNYSLTKNLTPSKTGSENVNEFITEFELKPELITTYYLSRPYATRHGAGKFKTETNFENLQILPYHETNIFNEHQKDFRYGYFDVDLIKQNLKKDLAITNQLKFKNETILHITHLELMTKKGVITKDGFKTLNWLKKETGLKITTNLGKDLVKI